MHKEIDTTEANGQDWLPEQDTELVAAKIAAQEEAESIPPFPVIKNPRAIDRVAVEMAEVEDEDFDLGVAKPYDPNAEEECEACQ